MCVRGVRIDEGDGGEVGVRGEGERERVPVQCCVRVVYVLAALATVL